MDIEGRLRELDHHYRAALSASVAAKTSDLALVGERSALRPPVDRAKERWQQLAALKREIALGSAELEELEHESTKNPPTGIDSECVSVCRRRLRVAISTPMWVDVRTKIFTLPLTNRQMSKSG